MNRKKSKHSQETNNRTRIVDEFNNQYSHGFHYGKDRVWDSENFLTLADFRSSTMEKILWEDKKPIPMSTVWLTSNRQSRFKRTIFDPRKKFGLADDELNLYKGLAYRAQPGRWTLLYEHIQDNVCQGNRNHCEWLIQWMASIVQRPWNKDGTAVVIRGGKGTGKSIFAECFGRLFHPYFVEISHASTLTSNFNYSLKDCLILNVDEGFWGGNKRGEGVLKNLVTQDHITIEPKGYERQFVPSFTHLIFTTNSEWAVPATADERRYFVLDCGTAWQDNSEIFRKLLEQLQGGGYSGLLHDLLRTKITRDLRSPPMTKGLREQILFSEPAIKKWLRDWIDDQDEWPQWMNKQAAYLGYISWCKETGIRWKSGKMAFYDTLKQYIPDYKEVRPRSMEQKKCIVLPGKSAFLSHMDRPSP